MAYQNMGEGSLNYLPCRYGKSKLLFRGPQKELDAPYIAFLGGTETYGKYVEVPFPDLVEAGLGMETINLGCVNAGVDVYLNDETVLDICNKAKTTVLQISGAQNMSNRFYAVHPRRNDRFLRASTLLRTIYREIDFTDFNFTRHLLQTLQSTSDEKFVMVRQELRDAWVARMRTMAGKLHGDVVLLWLSDHSPDDEEACNAIATDPLFVNRDMIDEIRPLVKAVVEVVPTRQDIEQGYKLMVYSDLDAPAAREMLGPIAHSQAATELQDALARFL
ncbi:DUF6473 family protein [Celeribacter neptunius]|uniref:DUF6473 domain-containing protein n=1 Tax=Celeribacter neptunius TaxID=588602 RepID=A0A1I3X5N9_9RHOB|nr:DUF6473 family protein [Celeribacter neptunius]SFK14629.1 hypothetical protein SAMN04487991_3976 [Celeribacter neptunius]